jgi:hypothetical protein
MSGECENCGEHALECKCDPITRPRKYFKKKDVLKELQKGSQGNSGIKFVKYHENLNEIKDK